MPFDPYHKWLGIPPAEQPPDYYRLLGITRFESDPDVISNAADQRMVYLQTFRTGQHVEAAERLLNEVSAARVCLLSPDNGRADVRAEYNRQLRTGSTKPPPPPSIPLTKMQEEDPPMTEMVVEPPPPPLDVILAEVVAECKPPRTQPLPPMPSPPVISTPSGVDALIYLAVAFMAILWIMSLPR